MPRYFGAVPWNVLVISASVAGCGRLNVTIVTIIGGSPGRGGVLPLCHYRPCEAIFDLTHCGPPDGVMYSRHDAVVRIRADDRGGDPRRAVARSGAAAPTAGANDVAVYATRSGIGRDRAAGLTARPKPRRRASRSRAGCSPPTPRMRKAQRGAGEIFGAAAAVAVLIALPRSRPPLALGSPGCRASRSRAAPQHPCRISRSKALWRGSRRIWSKPDDGRGWEVVAPFYLRLGRFEDAVKARRNAAAQWRERRPRGRSRRALIYAGNGIVTEEAKAAFERALTHAAKHLKARFFLGVAAIRTADRGAAAIWREMLADARPIRRGRRWCGRLWPASRTAPGPSAEDVAAAEQMNRKTAPRWCAAWSSGWPNG